MTWQTTTSLMPHQVPAVDKMLPTRVGGLFMDMGTGKALPLDTKIVTTLGMVEMRNISVGDLVIGANGKPTRVVGVYPQGVREVFKITFSDGTTAESTADHLWHVNTALRRSRGGYPPLVLPLSEIVASGLKHASGNRKYFIPLVEPVSFLDGPEPPIDPYLLGLILGDGYIRNGNVSVSTADMETVKEMEQRVPPGNFVKYRSSYDYDIVGSGNGTNQLLCSLRKLGLVDKRSQDKFVPTEYLWSSIDNRMDLLRGILDSDGHADRTGVDFITTSPQLARDVRFLVLSLGGLTRITEKLPTYTYRGERRTGQLAYRLFIRFPSGRRLFKLSRKRVAARTKYNPTRSIDSVFSCGFKKVQCIKVDASDGLFVIEDFVVTHNTRVAIETMARRQQRVRRAIVYCPVSLKETWAAEIAKHTNCPETAVNVFDDKTNGRNLNRSAFWHIIGIESVSSSNRVAVAAHELTTTETAVIVDESNYIRGHNALRTLRITRYSEPARYRLALTGTPISQGVQDLYAQMRFLSPKILGYNSFYSFAANHLEYSEKYPGLIVRAHNTAWLAAKIRPYVYQVTKEEAGLNLPRKLYNGRYFRLTEAQWGAYERAKYEILLAADEVDSYVIFQLFGALQQIASGFWNQKLDDGSFRFHEFGHNRANVLLEQVMDIGENEPVIIWCKYRYSIRQVTEALAGAYGRESVAQYYGDLDEHERSAELARWKHGDARFLVASMATGGHGLTLTEAAYAVFYENEFKYAHRLQAEDRCHRIGQTRRPTYVDIWARCGIEERIEKALASKGDAVADFRRKVDALKKLKGRELKTAVAEML